MQDKKYFSRSWSMLTRDRGWFKPLLVMSAANLVPIAGALGNKGYGLEWARLTAWGVDSAPKQKGVAVGKCIGSGWRGFVVDLVWGLIYMLATVLVSVIGSIFPGILGDLVSSLLAFVTMIVSVVWSIVVMIAEVRASIYESIGAGLKFGTVFQMIKRDTDGFFRVVLINLVGTIIIMVVMFFVTLLFSIMLMPALLQLMTNDVSSYVLAATLATSIAVAMPLIIIVGYAISFVVEGLKLIVINAVGLWMRQFNVPEWGRSEDPLPNMEQTSQPDYASDYPTGYPMDQQEPEVPFEPQPVFTPEPASSAAPAYAPAPACEPEPQPEAMPEPGAEPEVVPEFASDYQPEPMPEFVPEPESAPVAVPEPKIAIEAEIESGQVFDSDPESAFNPDPEPLPNTSSVPEPEVYADATQTLPTAMQETNVLALDATTELPRSEEDANALESAGLDDNQVRVDELYHEFLDVVKDNDLTDDE